MEKIAFQLSLLFYFCIPFRLTAQTVPEAPVYGNTEAGVDQLLLIAKDQLLLDSTLYFTELAIAKATDLNYQKGLLQAYYFMGTQYDDHSHLDKAMDAFQQAEILAARQKDTLMSIKVAAAQGYAQHQWGNLRKANSLISMHWIWLTK